MSSNIFRRKIISGFLFGCVILLLNFQPGFPAEPMTILALQGEDSKFYLLEFTDDNKQKAYFPLAENLKTWEKLEDWKNRSKIFGQVFPFGKESQAKALQENLNIKPADGKWGTKSWESLFKALVQASKKQEKSLRLVTFIFQISEQTPPNYAPLPYYSDDAAFFQNLLVWHENIVAKTVLNSIPNEEIVIASDRSEREKPDWLKLLPEKGFRITWGELNKGLQALKITNDQILVERTVSDITPADVKQSLEIAHEKFPDVRKSLSLVVKSPAKPFVQKVVTFLITYRVYLILIIGLLLGTFARIIWKNIYKSERRAPSFKTTMVEFERRIDHTFKQNLHSFFGKIDTKIDDTTSRIIEHVRERDVQINFFKKKMGEIDAQIQHVLNILDEKEEYETKDSSQRTPEELARVISNNIDTVKYKVKDFRDEDEKYRELLTDINSDILEEAQKFSPDDLKNKFKIDKTNTARIVFTKLKNQKSEYKNAMIQAGDKFQKLLNSVNKICNPLKYDHDFMRFFSDEYWNKPDNKNHDDEVNNLSEKFRQLEVIFPQDLKQIETQLQRASWITENMLKVKSEILKLFDLNEDVNHLSELLLREDYLGTIDERPEWTKEFSLNPNKDDKLKLKQIFGKDVWDSGLGYSMQCVQNVLFKLNLAMLNEEIKEKQFNGIYEFELASNAVYHLLQGVAISFQRLYHNHIPGQAVNLRFVTQDGDFKMLQNAELKANVDHSDIPKGKIIDVHFWGYCKIDKDDFSEINKSRVVVRAKQ